VAERDRIYPIQAERFANFAEYELKTTRKIPVVESRTKELDGRARTWACSGLGIHQLIL